MNKVQFRNYYVAGLLAIVLGLFTISGYSTVYYVSNSGNDSNSGLTEALPWKTLTKVNGLSFKPGDQILFQRGSTFYGTLTINSSGVAGNPILYGAYGTGANPVITGFTAITSGWTDEGGGIWSKVITSESQTNMVTIDDVQYGMGRYPNSTFLTYESASGYVSITDNQLTETPNWTGAEAVIYKFGYRIERVIITNHTSNTLTYSILDGSNMDASGSNKYFIQNDLRTLDQFGEWFHDYSGTGKLYMFFGAVNPTAQTVKVATLKNLCKLITAKTNITFDGLTFNGSINEELIAQYNCHNVTIQNCQISFAGTDGVYIDGQYATITNSNFNYCNRISIMTVGANSTISSNSVSNNAVILGQGNFGYSGTSAIVVLNDYATVVGNIIQNSGTNGIFLANNIFTGLVKNNYISNTCIWNWDSGSIYISGYRTALTIDGNIINKSGGNGIFLDNPCGYITVKNNSVTGCSRAGLFNHQGSYNSFLNNTVFNCQYGIQFLNATTNNTIHDVISTGNIVVAKTSAQIPLAYFTQYSSFASTFPTLSFSSNIYSRPIDDNAFVNFSAPGNVGWKTLEQWKSITGTDANSTKSPQSITSENDLQFEYNAAKTVKTITLTVPMIDMKGVKYANSVTLQPYSSIVLMKNLGDVIAPVISDFSIPATSTSLTVPISSLSASDNIGITGYLLTETSAKPTPTASGWSTSKPTSYKFTSEGTKSLYAWVKDLAGNISAGFSDQVVITLPATGNTLGYTEIYGMTSTWAARRAMPVTFSESASIQSISIYHNGGTGNVLLGVYSDQSGSPSTQLGVTSSTVISTSAGWQTVSLTSPVSVTAGQTVWLAWVFQNNPGVRYIDATPGRAQSTATWTGGMPATFGTSTIGASKYSIYCTYTKNEVNLGYTEIYGLTSTWAARRAMPVTFSESASIQSISIYHNGGTGNVLLGVYSDQSGSPSTQLGVTSSTVISTSAGWQTVSLTSPVSVTAGQTVWLAWVFQNNPGVRYIDATPGRAQSTATWTGGMPDAFGTSTIGASKYSIYCTYTTSTIKNAIITNVPEFGSGSTFSDGTNNQINTELSNLNYIDIKKGNDFRLYPNPSKTYINVDFDNTPPLETTIEIINLKGEKVFETLQVSSSNQIDVSGFPSGIYIVRSLQNKRLNIKKLIIP